MMEFCVVIPTYNPDEKFLKLIESIKKQLLQPQCVLIIDSGSENTSFFSSILGEKYILKKIREKEFNHGGTRENARKEFRDIEIVVFLTQDAILADENSLGSLVNCFKNKKVGAAFGRQLPHKDAVLLAAHARLFNYPAQSFVKSFENRKSMGIKTAFISDSFAAYRNDSLDSIGGFPQNIVLGEDVYVGGKMILKGWGIAYCGRAMVYHSHNYSIIEEMRRYIKIGYFYEKEKWIIKEFGKINREGIRFIASEIKYLIKNNRPDLIVSSIIRNAGKYISYKTGTIQFVCENLLRRLY